MKETQLLKKYVTAIFDLSKEKDIMNKSYDELLLVCNLINDNADLKQLIFDSKVSQIAKKNVFKELFSSKVSESVLIFLYVIFEKGRQSIMPFLAEEYGRLIDEDKGLKKALVTSAIELDENTKGKVETYVSSVLNGLYELEFNVNSDLIGGFMLRIDDKIYDKSIKGRLQSIKKEIIK